ncbi:MAG: hypothetical protein COX57_12420 [Alphaproteobacteria bacterium CG_4_10_14_0_2_um_filter_63_37]|nr:MAG: hypothetical protein COX57_12420 [Alphaproteobacteria bacterium CG_4_10_14_0_2_um_filter_63_37]
MFESLARWLLLDLAGLTAGSPTAEAAIFFIQDTSKIFVMLVVVIYLMGLVRALISPERVRQLVRGRSKESARGLAIGLGAVTPFCSCSSVPLFIGFVEAGIPLGVTFSFLIASPMINEVAVVLLAGIIGWKLALLYVAAGVVVAWVGGLVIERFHPERWVEDYVWKIRMGDAGLPETGTSLTERHRFAVGEVKQIVGRIWKWVLAGVGVGALFHGFVPAAWIAALSQGGGFWSVPAAVLMGIPLYSNAVGVIPVAEAMLGKGVALGTTLALMMSIAALSLPELIILRKVIRWPALALFVAILAIAITLVGWLFNAIA